VILPTVFSFASPQSNSALPRKLDLARKANGSPVFGLQYALNPSKAVAITFSIAGSQLIASQRGSIAPSFWALVNKDTMAPLTAWQPTGVDSPFTFDAKVAMTLSVSQGQVASVASSLSKTILVFALNSSGDPVANAYIDIAELCVSNPDQFLNLDTFQSGCN